VRCFSEDSQAELTLCVADVPQEFEEIVRHAWFTQTGDRFTKQYPKAAGVDQSWYKDPVQVERIRNNFARLGPQMFAGSFNWQEALTILARKFAEYGIEWYVFGSCCEAVRGIDIIPNDIDIIVHTKDFYKVQAAFPDNVIEPFVDNQDTWLVRYFGRLCVANAIVDIVAAGNMNSENHHYEKVEWNGFSLLTEPIAVRAALERQRDRPERLAAIKAYLENPKAF